ncbi:MAG: hypothetical protein ACLFU0_00900 [Alphaproteobacteria bacterium]
MPVQSGASAFGDDDAHIIDVVVKKPGVARLTRLSAPGDVEAVLRLLRSLADRDGAASTGGVPTTGVDSNAQTDLQRDAPETTSVG